VGECVGKHWAKKQVDWFSLAIDSVDIISQIKQGERERVIELLDLCRDELIESLFWLTKAVEESYPDRLKEWFEKLKSLQDSKIWTMQYGIGESIWDYTFELKIYERLSSIPHCHMHIIELLQICEEKFKETTLLKGSSRSDHFLRLALIAARCGFKSNAEEWLQYGIKSTLVYGYHKDITLFHLIDIMEMLNKHEPDIAIERCADILEMVDWMPHLTDGKETRHLPQHIFEQVAKVNTNAALRLLCIYDKDKARWQMQDCLEILMKQIQDGDPEILWALTSVFENHLSEDGGHPKQVVNAKQHVVEIVKKSGDLELFETFKQRLDHFIRTIVTPRHWSNLTSEYWKSERIMPHKEDFQANQETNTDSHQKTYKLESTEVTIQDIEDRMRLSFGDCKEILRKLKEENKNFYETDLTDSVLKLHISQASQSEDLVAIKDYLCNEDNWIKADLLRELGHRYIDLGDIENGLICLEVAYSNTINGFRWKRNKNDFGIIVRYDRKRAIKLLVNESYHSIAEYGGFDVSLTACAYDVLYDIENLRGVYQDYLHHCQELFGHLPKREKYKWLKNYSHDADDFDQLVVHFLVDELDTVEIDLGNRLIGAYRELCLARPEIALPIFVERLLDADELPKSRLLTILYMVAYDSPQLLIPYAEKISDILNAKHFQWKMITIKLLQFVEQSGSVSETVKERLRSAQHCYSPIINYSTFRLPHNNPSDRFLGFFAKNTKISNQDQIGSCCEILSMDKNAILANIEHVLKREGWTEEYENERLKNEWNGHVHPQGFPGVMILTTFDLRVFNLFNQILDEIVEKGRLSTNQLEALWCILQPADPEYKLSNIKPKPKDITPLVVSDKEMWLSELNDKPGKVRREPITQEWVTLFEQRILSQDMTYEVPYRSVLMSYSSLIIRDLLFSFEEFEKGSFYVLKLSTFDDNECITLDQARELLTNHQNLIPDYHDLFLPILTWKTNRPLFFGYHGLVSLPSYLKNQYGLTYKDFDLYKDGVCVMKYEVWQEGYQDESYSRELLSYGTRLMIHRSLLQKIFQDYDVELCQSIFEKRLYYGSKYDAKAAEMNSSTAFAIIHG
jgi:hypothetical protein